MSSVENDGHLAAQLKNNEFLARILDEASQEAWLRAVHAPLTSAGDDLRRAACAEVQAILTIANKITSAIAQAETSSRQRGGVA